MVHYFNVDLTITNVFVRSLQPDLINRSASLSVSDRFVKTLLRIAHASSAKSLPQSLRCEKQAIQRFGLIAFIFGKRSQ